MNFVKQYCTSLDDTETIFCTGNAEINGHKYEKNDIFVWGLDGGDLELPEFLKVIAVVQVRSEWLIYGFVFTLWDFMKVFMDMR